MEKVVNTVTLSLRDYEVLRIKAESVDNNSVCFSYTGFFVGNYQDEVFLKTNDPVIAKIKKEVEDFRENFKEFQKRKNKEQRDLCVYGEIQKVKKMSLIQFIKWRKSK